MTLDGGAHDTEIVDSFRARAAGGSRPSGATNKPLSCAGGFIHTLGDFGYFKNYRLYQFMYRRQKNFGGKHKQIYGKVS